MIASHTAELIPSALDRRLRNILISISNAFYQVNRSNGKPITLKNLYITVNDSNIYGNYVYYKYKVQLMEMDKTDKLFTMYVTADQYTITFYDQAHNMIQNPAKTIMAQLAFDQF